MYRYTPVLIIGIVCGFISMKMYGKRLKKIPIYFSVIALIMALILFYVSRGIDVYFDARNYGLMDSLLTLGKPGLWNEWLYGLLSLIGNLLKLDFYTFRIILISIAVLLMYISLKKYASNYGMVICIYMCCLIFIDAMQLQNFLAMAIFIFAIRYVLLKPSFESIFKYTVCIICAAEIHSAYWIALVFLCVLVKDRRRLAKILAVCAFALIIITYQNKNMIPYISAIMGGSSDARLSKYSASNVSIRGWIVTFMIHVAYTIVIYLIKVGMEKKNEIFRKEFTEKNYEIFLKKYQMVNMVFLIDLISFALVPFNMMISHMYRLIRNLSLLQYICVASNIEYFRKKSLRRLEIILGILATMAIWFVYEYYFNSTIDKIIIPVLTGEFGM